jgi:signal transduction histidine kinase
VRLPRNRRVVDALLALGAAAVLVVELALGSAEKHPTLSAVLLVVFAAPLAFRRTAPRTTWVAMVALGVVCAWLGTPIDTLSGTLLIVLLVIYSIGRDLDERPAEVGLALVVAGILTIVAVGGQTAGAADVTFPCAIGVAAWAIGRGVRSRATLVRALAERAEQLHAEREANAAAAVARERRRIARELHDVVAHGVSVMTLQAQGGARMLDSEPEEARRAFAAIEQTGRRSLVEMRRLLGMLRRDDDELPLAPQPSLSQLDALAEQVRAAGLPVELVCEGEPAALPPGVDLSAFRIVQEALTNALKHAGPTQAKVTVRYGERELELEVADSGDGVGEDDTDGGHGLVGMRERVSVFGGDLEAGRRPEGGYLVRVRLPLDTERP